MKNPGESGQVQGGNNKPKIAYSRFRKSMARASFYVLAATPSEVKKARHHTEMSQSKFAILLGVSIDTVKAWEQGKRTPEALASKVIRLASSEKRFVALFSSPILTGRLTLQN